MKENDLFSALTSLASALSLCAFLFIVITFCLFPRLRNMAYEFVVSLVFSNILYNLAYLKPKRFNSPLWCMAQNFLLCYGALAECMWCICIACTIHRVLLKCDPCTQWSEKALRRWRRRAIMICWCVPLCLSVLLLFLVIPWATGNKVSLVFGIKTDLIVTAFYLSVNAIPVWYVPYVYCRAFHLLKVLDISSSEFSMVGDSSYCSFKPRFITKTRFKYYPAVLFLKAAVFMPLALYFSFFWTNLVFSVVLNLSGFVNSVIYGSTEIVREEWSGNMRPNRSNSYGEITGFGYSEIVNRSDKISRIQDDMDPNLIYKEGSGQTTYSEGGRSPMDVDEHDAN